MAKRSPKRLLLCALLTVSVLLACAPLTRAQDDGAQAAPIDDDEIIDGDGDGDGVIPPPTDTQYAIQLSDEQLREIGAEAAAEEAANEDRAAMEDGPAEGAGRGEVPGRAEAGADGAAAADAAGQQGNAQAAVQQPVCARRVSDVAYEPKANYYAVENRRTYFPDYAYYENHHMNATADISNYEPTHTLLGSGTYAQVFLFRDLRKNKLRVVKVIRETKYRKIRRELSILRELQGGPSIPALIEVYKNFTESPERPHICMVFRLMSTKTLKHVFKLTRRNDIVWIMRSLLNALAYSHARGIMHRDVKLNNIIVDLERRRLELIDWGLSEYFTAERAYSVSVASLHYKGPELFTNNTCYDFTLDTWGAGVVLASLLYREAPFFGGASDFLTFARVLQAFERDEIDAYVNKFGLLPMHEDYEHLIQNEVTNVPGKKERYFKSRVTDANREFITDEAIDFLSQLLELDHSKRISPAQALKHPFLSVQSSYVQAWDESELRILQDA